ncbi:MAG: hypothetical protein E5X96_08730 [Mesorhizobium sp.]|nr:MAG: hypothetical protein E5X96_08730 [Mesorhizobium sp.]
MDRKQQKEKHQSGIEDHQARLSHGVAPMDPLLETVAVVGFWLGHRFAIELAWFCKSGTPCMNRTPIV